MCKWQWATFQPSKSQVDSWLQSHYSVFMTNLRSGTLSYFVFSFNLSINFVTVKHSMSYEVEMCFFSFLPKAVMELNEAYRIESLLRYRINKWLHIVLERFVCILLEGIWLCLCVIYIKCMLTWIIVVGKRKKYGFVCNIPFGIKRINRKANRDDKKKTYNPSNIRNNYEEYVYGIFPFWFFIVFGFFCFVCLHIFPFLLCFLN